MRGWKGERLVETRECMFYRFGLFLVQGGLAEADKVIRRDDLCGQRSDQPRGGRMRGRRQIVGEFVRRLMSQPS